MGSQISPKVANLHMEKFEDKALSTSSHPQVCGKDMLITLLWSSRDHIKIKTYNLLLRTPKKMELMPFLDTMVI